MWTVYTDQEGIFKKKDSFLEKKNCKNDSGKGGQCFIEWKAWLFFHNTELYIG